MPRPVRERDQVQEGRVRRAQKWTVRNEFIVRLGGTDRKRKPRLSA